ncbi:lytic transglycosylase domain-containing protein [Campylobacter fetus]
MKFLLKFSIFTAFIAVFLDAGVISYEQIKQAPKGLAKDYYIYRYINESKKATPNEIKTLRTEIYRYSGKLKKDIESIIGPLKERVVDCRGVNANNIIDANSTCQKMVLSVKFLQTMSKDKRDELAFKFKDGSPELANFIIGFDAPNPVKYYMDTNDTVSYFKFYNTSNNKEKFLNDNNITSSFIPHLSSNWQFKTLINDAVINKKFDNFRLSLLNISPQFASSEIAFLLGINAIIFNKDDLALEFFKSAAKTSKFASQRDNANFWIYLITKDKSILKTISKSSDINMYSLYAREFSGGGKIKIVVPDPSTKTLLNYDYTDPFVWQKTLNKVAKMSQSELIRYGVRFFTKSTLGEYSYIMEKAHNYKLHFYPTPFMEHIGTNDVKRQALILALARQESRFVPSAVSTSYALGMMQFMPFLANHIGKELGISNFDQDDMFKPEIAYKFANYHLDYLEKYLINPIFIAYAYNGGIGFTKRMLQRGDLFSQNSEYKRYEPFLSMELVPYAESRTYAKKVLANYIIYLAILNSNTKISQFFENLMIPGVGEKFRLNLQTAQN